MIDHPLTPSLLRRGNTKKVYYLVPPLTKGRLGGVLINKRNKMTILNNKREMLVTRKSLRNNQTKPEQYLWEKFKNKQFHGMKFRRQHSIGRYILDFYAPEYKIALEIDGENHFHDDQREYDNIRTEFLNATGIQVIRYTNEEIIKNRE